MYQNHLCQFCFIPNRGIFTIFAVIVLVVIGLIGWCAYRFLKKKKPKGAEDKKGEDDENALVDNEEANIEDVSFQNNFGLRYKCRIFFIRRYLTFLHKSNFIFRLKNLNNKKAMVGLNIDWNMILRLKSSK